MRKKAKVRLVRDGSEEHLRLLLVKKTALAINVLMRSLRNVKSSGPYTRDEMNER
jgi:hypothetical protein